MAAMPDEGDESGSTLARLSIRIDLEGGCRIGPGKIRLLELIEATGSISAAGRAMAMSYRRAWLLVESLNNGLRAPVVAAQPGGRHGGGAQLTAFGRDLIARYRAIEREAAAAADRHLGAIEAGEPAGVEPDFRRRPLGN
jgi:molybdate transport system regulatory protein